MGWRAGEVFWETYVYTVKGLNSRFGITYIMSASSNTFIFGLLHSTENVLTPGHVRPLSKSITVISRDVFSFFPGNG